MAVEIRRFKIHLFTSEHKIPNEADILVSFLEAGLDVLHIRKPDYTELQMGNLLQQIPDHFRGRTVVHDFYDIATRMGFGIQLNARNHAEGKKASLISRSCHSIEEAKENRNLDFVTLSPVFNSISKKGYESSFASGFPPKEELKNVVALGGVTFNRIPLLEMAGFAGAALLGEVWERGDGKERLLRYLRLRNLPLQFITDGRDIEETVSQAQKALDGGCRWIQVRMKGADWNEVREALEKFCLFAAPQVLL